MEGVVTQADGSTVARKMYRQQVSHTITLIPIFIPQESKNMGEKKKGDGRPSVRHRKNKTVS